MDTDAFEKLLALFDNDRDRAGARYETLRSMLITFFRSRGCRGSDILADRTFDIVARHLERGEEIREPLRYALGVARRMALGVYAEDDRTLYIEDVPRQVWDRAMDDLAPEEYASLEHARCLEECIGKLPSLDQRVIREYYQHDKREKIERRLALAAELNIDSDALRIRAFRIRRKLLGCVVACVRKSRKNATK
jgi:DNA-directed RNA polymerase specialized sigma24 family protein